MSFLLGNNDFPVDYQPPSIGSNYYKTLRLALEPRIFSGDVVKRNSKDDFRLTFDFGGYYKIMLQGKYLMFYH